MPNQRIKVSQHSSPVKVVLSSSKFKLVPKDFVINKRITHKNQLLPANMNTVKNFPKNDMKFTVTSATQPLNIKTNRKNIKMNSSQSNSNVTSFKLPTSEISIEITKKEEPFTDDDGCDENNDDQVMEIGEDWSFAEVSVSTQDNAELRFLDGSNEDDVKKSENYVDLSLLLSGNADTDGQTVKEMDDENSDDDEQAIIMADENGTTIIRLGSNHRFPFENMQFKEEEHEEKYNNSRDCFDESEIKSQVSDEEDTAKSIMAVADEQDSYDESEIKSQVLDDEETIKSIMAVAAEQDYYEESGIKSQVSDDEEISQSIMAVAAEQDCYDESEIKSQVSDDEEISQSIMAVAAEQEVEIEMFEVEYGQSNADDELEEGTIQLVKPEDGKFRCLLCDENDNGNDSPFIAQAEVMMSHLKNVHDARLYICDCGKIMRRRSLYNAHIVEHMPNKMQHYRFECTVCLRRFKKKVTLEEHLYKHTGNRPYACGLCDKTFVNKYKHQAHLRTHEERPRPFECEQCGKAFFTQNNLNQHVKTHTRIKNFKCPLCQKTFATQSILEVHVVTHTGKRPYACDFCSKSFTTKAILQNHSIKIHAEKCLSPTTLENIEAQSSTRTRLFPCEYCSKFFSSKDVLKNHIRIHTGERPFACDMCPATFTVQSNLWTHKRATHLKEKKYHCEVCHKQFARRRLLDFHTKSVHTGERPLRCDECPSAFINPEHLKVHVRLKHSDARPYFCEVCGKSFKLRYSRNVHRFVHSEKKPFECGTCGKGYGQRRHLLIHMKNKDHKSIVVNDPRLMKATDSPTPIQKNKDAERKIRRVDTNKPISDSET